MLTNLKTMVMSLYIKLREGMLNNDISCYSYSIVLVITIYSDTTRTPCTSCASIRDMVLVHSRLSASHSQCAPVVGSSMSSIIMGSSKCNGDVECAVVGDVNTISCPIVSSGWTSSAITNQLEGWGVGGI